MNLTHIDTYDHLGRHIEHETLCLCNDATLTVFVDYEREALYCLECGKTVKMNSEEYIDIFSINIDKIWFNK